MKDKAPGYDNPNYFFRLFHEGRPIEALAADIKHLQDVITEAEEAELAEQTRGEDMDEAIADLFGFTEVVAAPKTHVDLLADIW